MEIHQVKCDKCGKVENMHKYGGTYGAPHGWLMMTKAGKANQEFCSDCSQGHSEMSTKHREETDDYCAENFPAPKDTPVAVFAD